KQLRPPAAPPESKQRPCQRRKHSPPQTVQESLLKISNGYREAAGSRQPGKRSEESTARPANDPKCYHPRERHANSDSAASQRVGLGSDVTFSQQPVQN